LVASGRLQAAHRRPDTAGADWLWRAFLELSTCRAIGFGVVGPIPINAIFQYVDRCGLPDWTVDAVISIDVAWRAAEARRSGDGDMKQARPGGARDGR